MDNNGSRTAHSDIHKDASEGANHDITQCTPNVVQVFFKSDFQKCIYMYLGSCFRSFDLKKINKTKNKSNFNHQSL